MHAAHLSKSLTDDVAMQPKSETSSPGGDTIRRRVIGRSIVRSLSDGATYQNTSCEVFIIGTLNPSLTPTASSAGARSSSSCCCCCCCPGKIFGGSEGLPMRTWLIARRIGVVISRTLHSLLLRVSSLLLRCRNLNLRRVLADAGVGRLMLRGFNNHHS